MEDRRKQVERHRAFNGAWLGSSSKLSRTPFKLAGSDSALWSPSEAKGNSAPTRVAKGG